MKHPSRLLAAFLVAGLLAPAALAEGRVRYVPQDPQPEVTPENTCEPVTDFDLLRLATRSRTPTTVSGTVRGVLGSTEVPFDQVAGAALVEVFLIGDIGGTPQFLTFHSELVPQVRGKWNFRGGDLTSAPGLAIGTFVLRPAHDGTTASVTVKFDADIGPEVDWSMVTPGTTEVAVSIDLLDPITDCAGVQMPVHFEIIAPFTP